MKKTILLLLFLSCHVYGYSQDYDKITTKNGKSIICRIDSLTSTHIYFSTVVRNSWIHTFMDLSMVKDYGPYVIIDDLVELNKDFIDFNEGFIEFPRDKPFIKKGKIKFYKTWISLNNSALTYKGILYEVNDFSITLSNSVEINDYFENNIETMSIQVSDIKVIMTRKRNNVVRGVWIGAVSGFVAPYLVGLISSGGDTSQTGYITFFGAIPAAFIGAGIGALIASTPLKIHIHGGINKNNYRRRMLEKRALK